MWSLVLAFLPLVASKCYWNNERAYRLFGSKTPYDTVRGDFRDVPPTSGCEPVNIWFMVRHGTRRPNKEDSRIMKETSGLREEILKNYALGKSDLCAQDITDLRNWTWNTKLDLKTSHLTSEGYQELYEFGQRFSETYSAFLEDVKRYVIRPTSEQRTRKSSTAFVEGLQGINRTFVIEDPIVDDQVARPYRYCKVRGDEIINGTRLSYEVQRFQKTPEFKQIQSKVEERTGLKQELTPTTIMGIYDLCRFYRSYTVLKRDPWCSLFTDDELQVLEYVEDVRHYFRNGYGDPTNSKLGAAGLQDLYIKFNETLNTGYKSFTAYFTHDTMIDMIYSAIGLYKDYPKISGLERIRDRKWRTSFLTPFAANFGAILHRCTNTIHQFKVQFFVNEKELHFCENRLCTMDEFREIFGKFENWTLDFCGDSTYAYDVYK